MLLLQLPPELHVLVAGYLTARDLACLLWVHPSLQNDVLLWELSKRYIRATDGFALFHYVECKSKQDVLAMLAAGLDVNLRNARGRTALDEAVFGRSKSMIRLLLQESAPDLTGKAIHVSPLAHAIQHGDNAIMELLLRHGADPNDNTGSVYSVEPLVEAIQSGNIARVALLLSYGAEPRMDTSLLHDAAKANAPPSVVRMLTVELGLNIDGKNASGRTPPLTGGSPLAVNRRS